MSLTTLSGPNYKEIMGLMGLKPKSSRAVSLIRPKLSNLFQEAPFEKRKKSSKSRLKVNNISREEKLGSRGPPLKEAQQFSTSSVGVVCGNATKKS